MAGRQGSKKDSLQEKMEKLEALAEKVENGDFSINEIMDVYKESVVLVKSTKEEIAKLENEIITIENEG
jgi:exonuclease VII small subunit